MSWEIRQGDALERLREMPDESVQTVVTSPPYWGLRDYGDEGQLGLEPTPEQYVANLVEVFRELRRVLRSDGTVWLNLGDSYNSNESGGMTGSTLGKGGKQTPHNRIGKPRAGLKPKDLCGIPWSVAFALRADGWWLRSDIIWSKPNPMPESVTDRPTRAHEYLFLLTKSARYFFDSDAIREENTTDLPVVAKPRSQYRNAVEYAGHLADREPDGWGSLGYNPAGRNRRSVWEIATAPFAAAHFAVFPPKLVEPCILAGSPPECCGNCAAPWERVTERESAARKIGPKTAARQAEASERGLGDGLRTGFSGYEDGSTGPTIRTVGWQATCRHDCWACGGDGNGPSGACAECDGSGTRPGDDSGRSVVLDPFAGSGTTGVVALRHDRSFIGIELSEDYCEMARNRIRDDQPLFNYQTEVAA